ncbi:hypothetical protein [Priestia megaterium]|uniref:Uncharacterized protein n=1 Tax=Priestia megaterium TaxID=1404 RepID=A0A6M6E2C4_PRIMG|nr:hypothetical protein [Priestia megaterium]QJX80960.1 hypothetical protein FDZ14_33255 [Priestia megaterium]
MTMTKKIIQNKWETAVQKSNSKMKEALKKITFSDISDEAYDDNWIISVKIDDKTYHIDYDRKGKSTYSCFGFEKETGISLSDFEEAMQIYEGEMSDDLYKVIYTFTSEQKLELLKDIVKISGCKVKSPRYINGNLELVLNHPENNREYTICAPLEKVVISTRDNIK